MVVFISTGKKEKALKAQHDAAAAQHGQADKPQDVKQEEVAGLFKVSDDEAADKIKEAPKHTVEEKEETDDKQKSQEDANTKDEAAATNSQAAAEEKANTTNEKEEDSSSQTGPIMQIGLI